MAHNRHYHCLFGQMHSHGYQVSKSYLKIKKFNLLALFTMGPVSQWKVGNKNSALGNGCEGSGNRLVCLGHFSYRKCMENSKKCVFLESSRVFSIWFHLSMLLMTFDRQNRPPRTFPDSFWIFNLSSRGQLWPFWDLICPKMEYFAQKLTYTSVKWMT